MSWVLIIALAAILIVFFVLSSRSNKKRQKETQEMLDAVQPGNKVKTIGGICGIVVAVDPEDNTFVLETGTEATGKSYLKFDKQAIYQTDATAKKTEKAHLSEDDSDKAEKADAAEQAESAADKPAAEISETASAQPEAGEEPTAENKED